MNNYNYTLKTIKTYLISAMPFIIFFAGFVVYVEYIYANQAVPTSMEQNIGNTFTSN